MAKLLACNFFRVQMTMDCLGALVNSQLLFDYAQFPGTPDEYGRRQRLPKYT